MKIGIAIHSLNDFNNIIFNAGILQTCVFVYNFLIKTNNTFFLVHKINPDLNYKQIEYSNFEEIAKLNIIIFLQSKISDQINKKCIENNIKKICYHVGNDLLYYSNSIINSNNTINFNLKNDNLYDEIWLTPHFKYSIDFYKYIHQTENILIVPYIWEPTFIPKILIQNLNIINIGIVESNFAYNKSCFIPMIICERAKNYINKVHVFNSLDMLNKSSLFKEFALKSELTQKGKMTFEDRLSIPSIFQNHCNVILSFQDDVELNNLYFECFYLGIPLIHNSKTLKDWGYYYPKCQCDIAVDHIKNLLNNFNRTEYINKHKKLLYEYSFNHIKNIQFFNDRLSLIKNNNIIDKKKNEIKKLDEIIKIKNEKISVFNTILNSIKVKNNSFIHCNYIGGLGNQLFILFTGLAYQFRYNNKLSLDIKDKSISVTERKTYFNNLLSKLKNYTNLIDINDKDIYIHNEVKVNEYNKIPYYNKIIINGYFQSFKYFDEFKSKIYEFLDFENKRLEVLNKYNYNLDNSISIHFRLGDYKHLELHPILPIEYYRKSLLEFENIDNKNIYIFCEKEDNELIIEYIKDLNIKATIINHNIEDYEQFLIMMSCKDNIIANSSFSWWAAYLNPNENKKVICSDISEIKNQKVSHDKIPSSWKIIDSLKL